MKKPVLCLKGGRSPESAGALASHTGSLAAGRQALRRALPSDGRRHSGRLPGPSRLRKSFLYQPLPAGNGLGIISFSGAIGIQCIDAARLSGLTPAKLSAASHERLSGFIPSWAGTQLIWVLQWPSLAWMCLTFTGNHMRHLWRTMPLIASTSTATSVRS